MFEQDGPIASPTQGHREAQAPLNRHDTSTQSAAMKMNGVALASCYRWLSMTVALLALASPAFSGSQIEIPKPTDPLTPPPPPPTVGVSTLHLPVSIAVSEIATAADLAVPRVSDYEDTWHSGESLADHGAVTYQFRFHRGPVQPRMIQDTMMIRFPENLYRFRVRITQPDGSIVEGRCGYGNDPPKRVTFAARSRLSWTDAWTLQSHTTFEDPEFPDSCRLDRSDIEIMPLLHRIAKTKVQALAPALDAAVQDRSESKHRAETVWKQLHEPIQVTPHLWITLNPSDIHAGPIGSRGDNRIETAVDLQLKPRGVVGNPPAPSPQPLPPLQLASDRHEGFHLAIPVTVPYADMNRRLAKDLVGQEIDWSGGNSLSIVSAQLYGSGHSLLVELGIKGPVDGLLYVTGKPVLDSSTGILRFDELDFTIETRNVLARAATWLLSKELMARLEPETRIDLADRLDQLRRQLARALTRQLAPGTWLEGTVTALEPRGIYPVEGGVEVHVVAEGSLILVVR